METELGGEGNVEAVVTMTEPVGAVDQGTGAAAPDLEPGPASGLSIDEVDRLLDEVEAALSRLDDGTYGTCAACGGTIDDAWLAGSPAARTCEDCAPISD